MEEFHIQIIVIFRVKAYKGLSIYKHNMQLDKNNILDNFPNIKLSYENITHKKVYNADVLLAIPQGVKCFAWFTVYNDQNVCIVMELENNKQITNIKIMNACFHTELAYNTIVYGTKFIHANNVFFSMEDIFYYKGGDVSRRNWGDKLILFNNIMERDTSQRSYNNSFVVFGLPVISSEYDDLLSKIKMLKYKIECVQFRHFNKSNSFYFMPIEYLDKQVPSRPPCNSNVSNPLVKKFDTVRKKQPVQKEVVFKVKPDLLNDIYHLYCSDNQVYEFACIPDYTTSVMMNGLFRNIKENNNLDALEESDDEDEFQNENADRFVFLDKQYNMICGYNYKFKKWHPLRLADASMKVVDRSRL